MRVLKDHEMEQVSGGFEHPHCSLPSEKNNQTYEEMLAALRAGLVVEERDADMPTPVVSFAGFGQAGAPQTRRYRRPHYTPNILPREPRQSSPPRTLGTPPPHPGTIRGPFTFKTPYLNR